MSGVVPAGPRRLAGLAIQALSLYRKMLRGVRTKPAEMQPELREYARTEFDTYRNLSPKNYMRIEHLMRKGTKQLEMFLRPEFKGLGIHAGGSSGIANSSSSIGSRSGSVSSSTPHSSS